MSLNFIEILPNFDLFLHFIYMFILNHHILFLDLLYLIHLLISFIIIIMFLCLTFIKGLLIKCSICIIQCFTLFYTFYLIKLKLLFLNFILSFPFS